MIAGKDGIIRRVIIKYFNSGESTPRFSDRAVRSVAKIFSIDEFCLAEDLAILQEWLDKKYRQKESDDNELKNDDNEKENDDHVNAVVTGVIEPGVSVEDLGESEDNYELFNSTAYQVDCSDGTQASTDLWATLCMLLKRNHSAPMLDIILARFPIACSLNSKSLYPELVCNDNKGEQFSITMEEQNNMDMLSHLIMSVICSWSRFYARNYSDNL